MQSIYHTPGSTYLDLPDAGPLGDRQSIPDTIVCTKVHPTDTFLILFLDGGLHRTAIRHRPPDRVVKPTARCVLFIGLHIKFQPIANRHGI
jgi:hypothetical protein